MEGGGKVLLNVKGLEDGLGELGCEGCTSVRCNVIWETMCCKHSLKEELDCAFCIDIVSSRCKMSHFCEPIHKDTDSSKPIRFWELCDKIDRDGGPRSVCNWQWLEETIGLVVARLASLADVTSANIVCNILAHSRPVEGA